MAYAEAALRPRPREPPVTTATLPSREKSEGKSWSCASAMVDVLDGIEGIIGGVLCASPMGIDQLNSMSKTNSTSPKAIDVREHNL